MANVEQPCYTLLNVSSDSEPFNEMHLKSDLEKGDTEQKVEALKKIIRMILSGERLPPGLLMIIIRYVLPLQDHTAKKLLLIFWEIVPKTTPDGKLLQEMILVCDAYRKDLQHPNEFLRGSTLRFLCKLKEPELLEPLMPSIRACLDHRHSYVRRNAVLAIFTIYRNFEFLIPDAPELISNYLDGEQDMSCKRNAFLMLLHADQDRALAYLSSCLDQVTSFGDILQLVIVELIYKVCHTNPSERSRFIRCIYNLLNSNSAAVRYEAAGTLVTLSSAPTAIRAAASCYIDLIVKESDNNVKLIVLDKLVGLGEHPNYNRVLQDLVMDILRVLSSPDLEVRRKTLNLTMELVNSRNIEEMVLFLKKEVSKTLDSEQEDTGKYRQLLVRTLHSCCIKFPDVAMEIVRCRCCLNPKTAVYYPLSSILTDLPGGVHQTILKTLQIVTSSKVVLSDILPNEICEPCLLNLKVTYKFIVTFNESQELLKTLEQQIDDGVNVTDNFNNCVLPTSPVKEENLLESSTVQNLNNGLLDHNYYNISQIQSEADDDNEENVTGITIMTIEDVLEEEKKRRKRKMNEGDITKVSTVQNEIKTEVVGRSSNVKRERSEGEPGAYKCDICNMIYQSRTRLTRHKYSMHNENWMEVFKCSVCGESYDTSSKLRHHKESNHQDTVFICYLCGKVCRIKQHLRLHIQQRHSNPDQYKHLCPQCGRRFRSYCSLKYHLKQHDNIKNFVCRFCGFRSSSSCGLTRHERTHTGEKPYLCRFCPKQFSGKGDLKQHEDTHTGVRPYKCSYCPQTFTRTYNKKKHMMQHSGEYGCQMCKRKFIDLDVLKFHYHVKHRIVFDSSDADSKVKIENMIVAES